MSTISKTSSSRDKSEKDTTLNIIVDHLYRNSRKTQTALGSRIKNGYRESTQDSGWLVLTLI